MSLTQVKNLSISFPGAGEVVRDVNLTLTPGRCIAITGESGAGKSVLARSLIGLASEGGARARVSADELTIAGIDMRKASARKWRALRGQRVGFVLQDALQSLDPLRTVRAEVGEALRVRRRPAPTHVLTEALQRAGLPKAEDLLARRSEELSGGMRQRVLIASAIITDPPLIIADEPTTALDVRIGAGVLDLLAELRDAGATVLLITHDLAAARRIADEIVVMDAGEIVEHGPTAQIWHAPQHPATKALLAAVPTTGREKKTDFGPTVLEASGLKHTYRLPGGGDLDAVINADLTVRQGEVLGIVGESGSGKSTLARLLLGMEKPTAGEVHAHGRMRLVPQDPLGSFDPRLTAGAILHHSIAAAGTAHTPADLLARVHLPPETLDRYPRALSGGMRQRLSLARALAGDPDVLVLDEPTSALDATVQQSILDLLLDIQTATGMAMVFISHDLAVVRRMSHTLMVLEAGRIVEQGPAAKIWARPTHSFTRELLAVSPHPIL